VDASPSSIWSLAWDWYRANREHLIPLATFVAGSIVAWAALKQARTATRNAEIATRNAEIATQQAEIARLRHEEQTKADLQRRITESFTKAVEQLGSDKVQIRLGGIYTLERISQESELDYWPIMETLTGFIREHAGWRGKDNASSQTGDCLYQPEAPQQSDHRPPTDTAAVLAVIGRRQAHDREREGSKGWRFDFTSTDLRGAYLAGAHLEGAFFRQAHLERAILVGAHLERALLREAHLEGARLRGARLERAILHRAHLEGAHLREAHLEGADLSEACLKGANLYLAHLNEADLNEAHLEGVHLRNTYGLTQGQLNTAFGDDETVLPDGLSRPAHWPRT